MAIDQQRLLAAIDEGRENSYGTDEQSVLGQKRAEAIEAYLGLNTNPAPPGRSQVVDRSVYETISTMLPSLTRIFAGSSDDVCKFLPIGPEDKEGAEQTTAVISNVVTEQNQWEQICADWIHDGMLLCNGYAMAYWDNSERLVRERYEGQSDDQVAALLQDNGVRVVEHSQKPDDEANEQIVQAFRQAMQQYQMMVAQAQAAGQPPPPPPQKPQPAYLHDVVIDRLENDGGVCIKVLPPEHCYVRIDTPDWTLRDCQYFEYRCLKTIADLRAMGLDVPDDITDDETADSDEDQARDRFAEDRLGDEGKGVMRQVWARMIWVRCDAEDDGNSRLYYVICVGRTVLYAEPCARIPVSSLTPQPLPHRHIGMSIAETVIDIQHTKTAVKRGGLDNLYLANNGRHAISSQVNLADFLDARPGGVVRMLTDTALPGEGHIMPLTHPFAFGEIIGGLEYLDQERQNRSGASRYFSGTDAGAINKTASGTIALQNMASMRVEHVARMMAPAVEYLFSVVHELVSKHQNKPKTIKLRGKWTTVDPQAWRTKRDVRISVGVGAGNKESMMAQLQGVLGAQMQVGLPLGLVGRDNIHATNVEILKLAGFSNPERFWPDPQQLPPPQPQMSPEQIKAQTAMQLEQFKAQQEQMKFQAEQQLEQQRMAMQAELDKQREEMQARQKTLEQQLAAELEQMRIASQERIAAEKTAIDKYKADLQAAVAIQSAQTSAQTTLEGARVTADASVAGKIDAVLKALEALAQEIAAPTEIVRGPDGKAIGIKRGDRVRQIQRGPDGRAMGVQ